MRIRSFVHILQWKEYDNCIEYEKSEKERLAKQEKENAIAQEVNDKLSTSEGIKCRAKLNSKNQKSKQIFLDCVSEELKIKEATNYEHNFNMTARIQELQSLKQKSEVVETIKLQEEDWYNKREMFTKFFKGNYKLIKKVWK